MNKKTTPVFIVGTGRCGTRTMYRMLAGATGVEIHHEYGVLETQKLAALHSMGRVNDNEVKKKIMEMHGAAISLSKAEVWIDSSNKLSWIIDLLADLFPESRFLAIVRDGRKVVASYYYKLREEMYDDDSTQCLTEWLKDPKVNTMPPPEKRYWWKIPQEGQPWHDEFLKFGRLQKVSYHWSECNRVILESFKKLSKDRTKIIRLEDMRNNQRVLEETIEFIGTKMDESYKDYLKTPKNVFLPLDFQLTKKQLEMFNEICEPMMKHFGYNDREQYSVKY